MYRDLVNCECVIMI
ncbi:hypothetical protein F383_10953 [Gossypium arboreum]|uniref:Uncharacterized protein n=1 Tax=Gossypium arboreum TaxID=29729 RepID=A0A0B0PTU7_GOSAR|nr:hypothetical protein F383_10953 [Gossypium arboreum]